MRTADIEVGGTYRVWIPYSVGNREAVVLAVNEPRLHPKLGYANEPGKHVRVRLTEGTRNTYWLRPADVLRKV